MTSDELRSAGSAGAPVLATEMTLLEGEDPSTVYADDARHWVTIYGELVAFKLGVQVRVRRALEQVPQEARSQAQGDLDLIEAQLRRARERLAFWYSRQWELIGLDIDRETRIVRHRGNEITLTGRELQLLQFLAAHPNRYFPVEALINEAWHDSRLVPEQLRLYVARLRRKLQKIGMPGQLDNKPGRGYGLFFD